MTEAAALDVVMSQAEAMKRGALVVWTIYDRPRDYPDGFIARRFEVGKDRLTATSDTLTGGLEHLRAIFGKAGLIKLARQDGDERPIVESWV
jgi:hypothetical protein